MEIIELNDNNFNKVVFEDNKTVLVDFYATWCGPCKMLSPVIEEYIKENNNIIVGKVNVDNNEALAFKYQVFSIPTLLLVKDGKVIKNEVGYKNIDMLRKFIET